MMFRLLTGLLKQKDALPVVVGLLYPREWLDAMDTDEGRTNMTNRESVMQVSFSTLRESFLQNRRPMLTAGMCAGRT